jgi:pimeloyl-ACP methyl ester carboxylesterase
MLMDEFQCPVILFDYRGSGISQVPDKFRVNAKTLIEDACQVINQCRPNILTGGQLIIWGSSLGGGLGAVGLSQCQWLHRGIAPNIKLVCHDSFTTTA